jgi:hypothetical protein
MSVVKMQTAPINEGAANHFAFEYEGNLAAGGDGDSVLLPDEIQGFSVTVSFTGGGTGYVSTTTDTIDKVKAGTAVWVAWPEGTIAATHQDYARPCTAIKMTQVAAGTMKMTVRAQ